MFVDEKFAGECATQAFLENAHPSSNVKLDQGIENAIHLVSVLSGYAALALAVAGLVTAIILS